MRLIVLGAVLLIVAGCATHRASVAGSGTLANTASPVAFTAPPATAPAVDLPPILLNSAIQSLRQARDLDAARAAYARGIAIDPDSLPLNRSYVAVMIGLDFPELAYDAADKVLAKDPGDGPSRAVIAFMEARQGKMSEALADIASAVKSSAHDPFVQDTAGHLLGWFDRVTPAPVLPDAARDQIRHIHSQLDNELVFGAAYQDASLYYLHQGQSADTSSASSVVSMVPTDEAAPIGTDNVQPQFAEVQPLIEYVVPFFDDYAGLIFETGFFGSFGGRRPIDHRPRRHEPEFNFRDHFFGRGYTPAPVSGVAGVTPTAYLRQRFPAAFMVSGNRGGVVMTEGHLPAGVLPGTPGYNYFTPNGGIQAGGAANLRVPGFNTGSLGAIGLPPGFIATPISPAASVGVAASGEPIRSAAPSRGSVGARGGSAPVNGR